MEFFLSYKSFKSRKKVTEAFFSKVSGFSLTKKWLHQRFFLVKICEQLKVRTAFFQSNFWQMLLEILRFWFWDSNYSMSLVTLRQLSLRSPTKTIWLTNQIKILYKQSSGAVLWNSFPSRKSQNSSKNIHGGVKFQ